MLETRLLFILSIIVDIVNRLIIKYINFVPSSANTLMISFIGMRTQEVAIARTVNVTLQADTKVLDDVMVVAFGSQKK